MRKTLAVLTLLLLGCAPKPSDSSNALTEPESFNDFFQRFKSDSLFQVERVEFPFVVQYYSEDSDSLLSDEIQRRAWRHKGFEYEEEYSTREFDAYTQQVMIFPETARIELRGVDNGIWIDFFFKKIEGKWFLTIEKDFSD